MLVNLSIAAQDFIAEHGPTSARGFAQLKWARLQLADPNSPLAKWTRVDVMQALAKKTSESSHEDIQTESVISLMDWSREARKVLRLIVRSLKRKGVFWLGIQGSGKTPCSDTLGFAFSRFHQIKDGMDVAEVVGRIRSCNDLDFQVPSLRPATWTTLTVTRSP